MKPGTEAGAMPAKVSENIRPTVIAGLAKLVELVNQGRRRCRRRPPPAPWRAPGAGESVDVVISNCVINLAAEKRVGLAEAARVLRPGGRFAISDVIADEGMDEATRADMQRWTGCIAGALTEVEFRATLADVGFVDVEIRPTHRVHTHAGSAIIRARKP